MQYTDGLKNKSIILKKPNKAELSIFFHVVIITLQSSLKAFLDNKHR